MNKKKDATLVIMAAGIGSRFGGGIKQLAPVGPNGEIIMDYSIYDAKEAGFTKVVFVIRKDLEKDFRQVIGNRMEKIMKVSYAFQEVDDIPESEKNRFAGRTKPWGTGQAILCCKDLVDTPFLVINADDYYGKEAFLLAYEELTKEQQDDTLSMSMISFILGNTLSDHGGVTRGICHVNEEGYLSKIEETRGIEKGENCGYVMKKGILEKIPFETPVSMNMWGFSTDIFCILEEGFREFVEHTPSDDLTAEYLLPTIVGRLLEEKKAKVKVLKSKDKWFGVTYQEDKEEVIASIRKLISNGVYSDTLLK